MQVAPGNDTSIGRVIGGRLLLALITLTSIVAVNPTPALAACGDAPGEGVDWSGCSFAFAELADVDLRNADLSGVDLSYAVLFRADLSGADLRGADLRDSFPIGANLTGADLTDADLGDADLVGANLTGAILRRANLSRSDVDFSSIADASFVGADLADADFSDVTGADQATFGLAPAAADDAVVTWDGRAVTIDVTANDDAADVNPFASATVQIASGPGHGNFDPATGVYKPTRGYVGPDRFTYRLVHTLPWTELPAGVGRTFTSTPATVEIEIKSVVRVDPPYAGASGIEGEIVRLYVALMRRQPDPDGFAYWVEQRRSGRTLLDVAGFFGSSSEFLSANTDLDNVGFVTLLYNNVLEREPDDAGRSYWVRQLDDGVLARNEVTLAFSESNEFKDLTGTS